MTTWVTGANGMVGSRMVARLLQAGERVVAVGRGAPRVSQSAEYVELDLRTPEKLSALIEAVRPRGGLHAAARTDVDAREKDPAPAWRLNYRAVERCALGGRAVGAR